MIKKKKEKKKLNLKKSDFNGVTLMEGIEDYLPEEADQDDVYQLIEESLKENIVEVKKGKTREAGTITKNQAKIISTILYDKIKKGKLDKSGKIEQIDTSKYPELKGVEVKIGIRKFTKDVVKDYLYTDEKVDDSKVDKAYSNLNKNNESINALTIEIK